MQIGINKEQIYINHNAAQNFTSVLLCNLQNIFYGLKVFKIVTFCILKYNFQNGVV